jgi:hypothetical protein
MSLFSDASDTADARALANRHIARVIAPLSAVKKTNHKPGDVDTLFRSGDDKQDAIVLLDCAYDIMEIWKTEGSPYNQRLKKAWMQRARELGAVPSP